MFNFVKGDLNIAIDQAKIEPGSLVVIRPKYKHTKFSEEYSTWLASNLAELLPPGTKAMILVDDSTEFQVLNPEVGEDCPPDQATAYRTGWYNAFGALEKACS